MQHLVFGQGSSGDVTSNPAVATTNVCSDGNFGESLGVTKDWVSRIIKAVGNYGESFDRNVGAGSKLGIARGLNQLWNKGGIQYAPPIR